MAKGKSNMLIIALGDGSINAVNRMISNEITDTEYLAISSSLDHLKTSKSKNQIYIGDSTKNGCSADPECGKQCMEEHKDNLNKFLEGVEVVFLVCAMGGGTGTGAAPVVAGICKDLGIITVGVVSTPFMFEGNRRNETAHVGVSILTKMVDTIIEVPNENILKIIDKKTRLNDAFAVVDSILSDVVKNLVGFITTDGERDFNSKDIKEILKDGGKVLVASGYGENGDLTASAAMEVAISNQSFIENIAQAKNILVSFSGDKNIEISEMEDAIQVIRDETAQVENIFLGFRPDKSMKDVISAMIFLFTEGKKRVATPIRWDNVA